MGTKGLKNRKVAASVYNSLGFEWVNPVLSLFEDWVLGWVLQTGLLFFSLFQIEGGEGDTPFMTAPFFFSKQWA